MNGYRGVWDAYWKGLDTDGDNAVTLQEVLSAAEGAFQTTDVAASEEFAKQINMRLVSALDADGNGEIRMKEYTAFVGALGVNEDDAAKAFNKLDRNGSGVLLADEIAMSWAYYYASDDLTDPSNWFYGEF